MRVLLPLLATLLLAGCAAPIDSGLPATQAPTTAHGTLHPVCPGHWHATFGIFLPNATGEPTPVDMATPRAPNGAHYYDLVAGMGMGLAVHMHQSGAERGSQALGPAQWHFERDGACVSVDTALRSIEVNATADALHLYGGHAQAGQDGHWSATAGTKLRWFIETEASGKWAWRERTWDELKGTQLPDGAVLLVALGSYSDAQVEWMQAQVPKPVSRLVPA